MTGGPRPSQEAGEKRKKGRRVLGPDAALLLTI